MAARRSWFAVLLTATFSGCVSETLPPDQDSGPLPQTPVTFEAIRFDTELGPLAVILYPEAAPKTVERMKTYIAENYYVGREFGRVVPGHVIQITDNLYTGATDDKRTVPLEPHADYHFSAGALGIARSEDPNSGGPEFFIMDFATSHLDGNYTVWGQVIEGLDVVRQVARVDGVMPPTAIPEVRPQETVVADPVAITGAELTTIDLPGDVAAHYPYQVAKNVREGDLRHTMDWPRDLRAGEAAELTWYARPYGSASVPDASEVSIRIADTSLAVLGDPFAAGVYHFSWAPTEPGEHVAKLVHENGREYASLTIHIA